VAEGASGGGANTDSGGLGGDGGGLGGTAGGVGGQAPDSGGISNALGNVAGVNTGIGPNAAVGDITNPGNATSTASAGGGLADITAAPDKGFFDKVSDAIANFDFSGAAGGMIGSMIGGLLGPVGMIGGMIAGRAGGDYLGAAMGSQNAQAGLDRMGNIANAIGSGGGVGPQPGGAGPSETSALLPSSNAAIALGVPTGTTTQNVAQSLGVGS
jgi:hypothetical protein